MTLGMLAGLLATPAFGQSGAPPGIETAREPLQLPDLEESDTQDRDDAGLPVTEGALPGETAGQPADPSGERKIDFEANTLEYDSDNGAVTASGNVILRNQGRSVRADSVTWNRDSGQIVATGNVRFVDPDGNQLYTDRVELTDEFDVGSLENLLLVLREGGRLAAERGTREVDGTVTLTRAAYTACDVETSDGCPKRPSWRITAERVVYDSQTNSIRFRSAYLELFGAKLIPLPGLSLRTDGSATSGVLVPDVRFSRSNGLELSGSYYYRLANNMDATVGASVYSKVAPMVSGSFRHLTDVGAYQITGYATYSSRISNFTGIPNTEKDFRGYIFANGKLQFDPNWSLTASIRRTTDKTFLRRYDLSRDDRLRSLVELERIDRDSYLLVAGYATQTLRLLQPQGQVPIALPLIDYRRRLADPLLGGKVELQANTLAIQRPEGQDTQRAFASARWDLRSYTGMGQIVQLTALARADVYHSDENYLTETAIYRGNPGWQARGVGTLAADIKWPFVGSLLGGTQVLTPRIQFVATPNIRNLSVPNEDSRAIDLEDSNLFSLNRFPGYDRVEDGARITYGVDWQLTRPDWRVEATLGQSYRFDADRTILPDGTGLAEQLSDFVGRTQVRYKDFISFTHRYRIDKDNFAVRRNEIDATIGNRRTYAEVGYLRLNRNVDPSLEDLRDREEARVAARVAFARYWSVFGSGVINLTDRQEDSTFTSDGFDPIVTRLGVAYQDDCLEMGLTWKRNYQDLGDAQRGDTFQVYFRLRNLGFR
ncbi:LPS assembly protein LptD [Erythrobacter sp. LQ02-29]|uniref:LPS-assembly protein LptD n=1 Tax=Erythrobacter sp. LQ02-29 TaxID=2920384 RepID=UPI001F4E952B|nr:LPS assembly protein LptD [Erythrobacter sp. LQ02-29]MCP9222689.1 LPS assembly protein LptD [Erythrobacter sp. LQ02-29]